MGVRRGRSRSKRGSGWKGFHEAAQRERSPDQKRLFPGDAVNPSMEAQALLLQRMPPEKAFFARVCAPIYE